MNSALQELIAILAAAVVDEFVTGQLQELTTTEPKDERNSPSGGSSLES